MDLLVDIGNSKLKWCFSNAVEPDNIQGFRYSINMLEKLLFSNLLNDKNITNIKNIFVCCVAEEKIRLLFTNWVNTNLSKTPVYYESSDTTNGVENAYSKISDLGNDRWLALVYVHHFYQADVCIIDCGTAITIDVILKNGKHEGGLIAPGYFSQISALQKQTDIKNKREFVNQKKASLLQNNTNQCIEQGCRLMSLGFIKSVVEQLKSLYGDKLQVVITGGDSESYIPDLPAEWHYCQELMFLALQFFSNENELNKK